MLKSSERVLFDSYECIENRYTSGMRNYETGGEYGKKMWTKILELCQGQYVNHVVEQEKIFKYTKTQVLSVIDAIIVTNKFYDVNSYITVYYNE